MTWVAGGWKEWLFAMDCKEYVHYSELYPGTIEGMVNFFSFKPDNMLCWGAINLSKKKKSV